LELVGLISDLKLVSFDVLKLIELLGIHSLKKSVMLELQESEKVRKSQKDIDGYCKKHKSCSKLVNAATAGSVSLTHNREPDSDQLRGLYLLGFQWLSLTSRLLHPANNPVKDKTCCPKMVTALV